MKISAGAGTGGTVTLSVGESDDTGGAVEVTGGSAEGAGGVGGAVSFSGGEGIEAGAKKNALKTTAAFPVVMLFCYLLLILYFRSRGGYKAVELTSESTCVPAAQRLQLAAADPSSRAPAPSVAPTSTRELGSGAAMVWTLSRSFTESFPIAARTAVIWSRISRSPSATSSAARSACGRRPTAKSGLATSSPT